MKMIRKVALATILGGMMTAAAHASDLRVAPVIIEPLPGTRTTNFTLINEEARPLRAQVRIMRWSMVDGKEVLTPTSDLVASPPLVALKPKQHYLVRLVRTAKAPPVGEESYRVLVDEVPDPKAVVAPGSVQLVLRLSIPVFISDTPRRTAQVKWSVERDGNGAWLTATNSGNRRLRVSDLSLTSGGNSIYRQSGLVGYVLAGSTTRFPIAGQVPASGQLELKATGDTGPVEAALAAGSGA